MNKVEVRYDNAANQHIDQFVVYADATQLSEHANENKLYFDKECTKRLRADDIATLFKTKQVTIDYMMPDEDTDEPIVMAESIVTGIVYASKEVTVIPGGMLAEYGFVLKKIPKFDPNKRTRFNLSVANEFSEAVPKIDPGNKYMSGFEEFCSDDANVALIRATVNGKPASNISFRMESGIGYTISIDYDGDNSIRLSQADMSHSYVYSDNLKVVAWYGQEFDDVAVIDICAEFVDTH